MERVSTGGGVGGSGSMMSGRLIGKNGPGDLDGGGLVGKDVEYGDVVGKDVGYGDVDLSAA